VSAHPSLAWLGTLALLLLLVLTGVVGASTPLHVRAATQPPAASPSAAAPSPAETPAPAAPLHMLFVGASITAGVGASRPEDGFPAVVERTVQAEIGPTAISVVAHNGAVVEETTRWDLPMEQNVLVVHMVTNDFERATPLAIYRENLRWLLARLRGGSPRARLICLGAWQSAMAHNRLNLGVGAYDGVAKSDCEEQGGVFVPLVPYFMQASLHNSPPHHPPAGHGEDGFHPNDLGHERIALAVLEVLLSGHTLDPHGLVQVGAVVRYH
jgi:lysophospholipase L1-like esterase